LAGIPENGAWTTQTTGLSQNYTASLSAGLPYLLKSPDPRLLALTNPYDPVKNAGLRLLDASLFKDHYYLYFGIAPWAVLLVPWHVLTNTYLSDAAVIWIFCSAGFICYSLSLWKICRHYFPSISPFSVLITGGIITIAAGVGPLLLLPQLTQIPSAAAYGFLGLAWFAIINSEICPKRRIPWLSVALLAAGLTMGSRPNYAPAIAVIVLWTLYRTWNYSNSSRGLNVTLVMLPFSLVGAGLALWNATRFGNPLEFGFSYQLVGVNRSAGEAQMSWRYLAFNLHRYILGGARWVDYFPFIAGEADGPFIRPSGHEASDQVYGFLWVSPVLFTFLATFFSQSQTVRNLAKLALICGGGILVQLSAFGGSAYRYPADYLPCLALAAGIGFLQLYSYTTAWSRTVTLTMVIGLLAWSSAASIFQIASLYDVFASIHPRAYTLVSSPFNALVYLRERYLAQGPRSIQLNLNFPTDRIGQVEPLVILGPESQQDFLYVYYSAVGQLRFGFEAIGRGGPVGRGFDVDLKKPHILDLYYGSFLPPDDHPLMHSLSNEDRTRARRTLTVLLDGEAVLDGWADFHPPRGLTYIGYSPNDNAFGTRFTGIINSVKYPLLVDQKSSPRNKIENYGALRIELTLRSTAAGTREPLISFGHRNQGQLFVLERLDHEQVRLGVITTDGTETWSSKFDFPIDVSQTITIATGALYPPITSNIWINTVDLKERQVAKKNTELMIGNRIVWRTELPSMDISPTTITVGRNDLLLNSIKPTITADVTKITRLAR